MQPRLHTRAPLANLDAQTIKSALEASRSPLIITDNLREDNPIIYSNSAFLELTEYGYDEVIGRNCRFLQGPDTDKKVVRQLRKAVNAGSDVRVTLKNYTKNGRPFWNDLVMSPVQDKTGRTTHFMGMQLDITERIESQERLRQKTGELEKTNQELEQFTYATSHDLQEPLRMISSYLQLLNKRYGSQLDSDGQIFLGFATEGADRMQELINDLLTLSRISDTSDTFRTVRMGDVVQRAKSNLQSSIEDTQAVITVGELPTVFADPVQMVQLFQNLISNAIKYCPKGRTPHITIGYSRDGDSDVFSVIDNGIGIARQHYERIFVIFQRLHTRREYPGTGIGLAICSKIVDRHGGRIWVESEEGTGSTFRFSIPSKQNGA